MDKATEGTAGGQSHNPARRRSSGPRFEGLMNLKRGTDAESIARRNSLNEQKPPAGMFGQMWNNFTRGTTNENPK